MKLANPAHDFISKRLIQLATAFLRLREVRLPQFADDERDLGRLDEPTATRKGLVGAKDAHRQHRSLRFGDEETHTSLRRLQLTRGAACAFREDEHLFAIAEQADGLLERSGIRLVTINRNGLPATQHPASDRMIKKRLPGKVVNGFLEGLTDKRRIEEAHMVAGHERRACHVQTLRTDDAKVGETTRHLAEK